MHVSYLVSTKGREEEAEEEEFIQNHSDAELPASSGEEAQISRAPLCVAGEDAELDGGTVLLVSNLVP